MFIVSCLCFFFFFKQKTAYEMRISDWSSDVCSSDLTTARIVPDPATPDPLDGQTSTTWEELVDNDGLRQAPLFSALDDEAATALRSSMGETRLHRSEVLFHEGDSGDKIYFLLTGKVNPGRTYSDVRQDLRDTPGPG